ncbi:MAG: YtxH domain-containing protein [Chloroflexota bacterium]|nr:YtxH domain-containing protein [Anaerolineales bacterium]
MKNLDREYDTMRAAQVTNGARHVLTGLVVGGVIGATAMLFLAPRSGEEMRSEVKDKALELRDRTSETVKDTIKDTLSQVKSKKDELTGGVKGKAQGLKHKGQDMLVEKLDRATEAVEAARKAIQEL